MPSSKRYGSFCVYSLLLLVSLQRLASARDSSELGDTEHNINRWRRMNAQNCDAFLTNKINAISSDCKLGGHYYIASGSQLQLTGSSGTRPVVLAATNQGHIRVSGTLVAINVAFHDSEKTIAGSSNENGGSILIDELAQGTFTNVDFVNNRIMGSSGNGYGAAVHIGNRGVGKFTNVKFQGNQVENGDGGAVYIKSGMGYFTNCTFVSNSATNGRAGGVYANVKAFIQVVNNVFSGNLAPQNSLAGVHIYYEGNTPIYIIDSVFNFTSNQGNENETAVYGPVGKCSKNVCETFGRGNAGIGCRSHSTPSLGIECRSCEPGKVRVANSSQFTCKACLAGTFSRSQTQAVNCTQCLPGLYQDEEGQSSCKKCESGKYGSNAMKCFDVVPGFYPTNCSQNFTGCLDRQECERGHKCEGGATEAIPCQDGTYQPSTAKSYCVAVPKGYYSTHCIPDSYVGCEEIAKCSPGYKCSGSASRATLCPAGTYTDIYSATTCYPVPPGMYAINCINSNSQSGCRNVTACEPGQKCAGGVSQPMECSKGQYQGEEGKSFCKTCPRGKFSSAKGQSSCDICLEGHSCNVHTGTVSPEPCLPGTYAAAGSTICQKCNLGTFSSGSKSKACSVCPVGKYQDKEGEVDCIECPIDTFSSREGNTDATDCLSCNSVVSSTSTYGLVGQVHFNQSCFCKENTIPRFSKVAVTSSPTLQSEGIALKKCNPCPNNIAVCKRPTKNSNKEWFDARFWARPKMGHYEHAIVNSEDQTKTKRVFYACPDQDVCLVTGCRPGTKGIFCKLCAKGYAMQHGKCIDCSRTSYILNAILVVVGVILGIAVFTFVNKFLLKRQKRLDPWWKEFLYVLRLNIDYFQIGTALIQVINVPWPENFTEYTKNFEVVNFDVINLTGLACLNEGMNFRDNILILCLIPLLVIACIVLQQYLNIRVMKKEMKQLSLWERKDALRRASEEIFKMVDLDNSGELDQNEFFSVLSSVGKSYVEIKNIKRQIIIDGMTDEEFAELTDDELQEHIAEETLPPMTKDDMARYFVEKEDPTKISLWWWRKRAILRTRSWLLQFCLLIHTPITRRLVQYFHCKLSVADKEIYLVADYRIKCYDGDYFKFLGFIVPFIIMFTIGLPSGIAVYLRKHRKELDTPNVVVQVGFLYSAYRKGAEFWEMHEIGRKLLLTCAILFYQSEPSLQAGIAIGICFIAECVLNYFQPQRNRNLFWLAQISFFFTGVKFGFSFLINGVWGKNRAQYMGLTLICLDSSMLLASILLMVQSYRKLPKVPKTDKNEMKTNLKILPSAESKSGQEGRKVESALTLKSEADLKGEICDMLFQFYGETSFEYKQGKSLMDEFDDMDEDEFRGEVKAFLEDMRDEADAKEQFTKLCNQLMYR